MFRLARTTDLSEKLPPGDGELQLAEVNINIRKAAQKPPHKEKRYEPKHTSEWFIYFLYLRSQNMANKWSGN
jgi:hypothetical protein